MARLDGWFDPELEELFRDDRSLMETARRVRATRPAAEADPGYRRRLRAELMVEAQRSLRPRSRRRFALRLGFGHVALAGAALGTALAAAAVVALLAHHVQDHVTIEAYSNVSAQHAVSPDDVITVAFNQPMDQQAVVQGLSIRPATQVTTSWQGNNLVISPTHHLAGNTPYTVTIAQTALRTTAGATAAAPVQIAFGTAPTPTPSVQPPALSPTSLGQAGGAYVLFAPDGGVVATGVLPSGGTGGLTGGGSATPSASPGATVSPGAAGGAQPSHTVEFTPGGGMRSLGPVSTAAAFSPNGSTLAYAVRDGNGGADLVVSDADGSSPHTLIDSPSLIGGLTWVSNDVLAYTTATAVHRIDLSGTPGSTVALPAGYTGFGALAPRGGFAFAWRSGGPGALVDLSTGALQTLSGSQQNAAFSADGGRVAWVDTAHGTPQLWTMTTGGGNPVSVATLYPGLQIGGVALSGDGSTIAYVQGTQSTAQLVVAKATGGAPIAVGPAPSAIAFSPQGDAVALLVPGSSGSTVERATLPGVTAAAPTTLPPAAMVVLNRFVNAQVAGDQSTLQQLSSASVDAAAQTPSGLSRAYQISTVARADGTVTATVELIVDPSATRTTPLVADETLTLSPDGSGAFVVSGMTIDELHDESSGPHVMNVSSAVESGGSAVITVTLDSDLNPATVPRAVTVSADGQQLQPGAVGYDPDSRTVTITVSPGTASLLTLSLSTSLQDVDGNPLAASFSATVAG